MTSNQTSSPTLYLRGDTAALGPLDSKLVELYWRWENNPRVRIGYGQQTPESLEERTEGLGYQLKRTAGQARFTVYDVTGPEPVPVGTTALTIDHPRRTAEFFILVGEDSATGKGIGTESTRLTLDYAFHITNLRCVYLSVLAPNTAAIRAYEKAGFRKIGERRNSGYWLGEPANELFMDATPTDFPGPSVVKKLASQ
jgi:diamine N-acetyltransferase